MNNYCKSISDLNTGPNYLIMKIAQDLKLKKCPMELIDDYISRVIYSASGVVALETLNNNDYSAMKDLITIENDRLIRILLDNESQNTSIIFLKNTVYEFLNIIFDIYPNYKYLYFSDYKQILSNIYDIYLKNGFFYHSKNHITPSNTKFSRNEEDISFVRTKDHKPEYEMSGLGFYRVVNKEENDSFSKNESFQSLFGLDSQKYSDYFNELLQAGQWEKMEFPPETEYLQTELGLKKGTSYWTDKPKTEDGIGLARFNMGAPKYAYYLYKYENSEYGLKEYYAKPIEEWRLQDFCSLDINQDNYRKIANALLIYLRKRPAIVSSQYRKGNDLILIDIGYKLPPAEERFFCLYSWPDFEKSKEQKFRQQVFRRIMKRSVYQVFRNYLIDLGYEIKDNIEKT